MQKCYFYLMKSEFFKRFMRHATTNNNINNNNKKLVLKVIIITYKGKVYLN